MRPLLIAIPFVLLTAIPGAQEQRPTLRTSTSAVLIDVTVVDKDGRPITDLQPQDFELAEDGKTQQILSVTAVQAGVASRLAAANAAPDNPAQAATTAAPAAPATPTVTAIVFDNLSPDGRPAAARAAAQFISTLATGREYAGIFQSGQSLTTILRFTNRTGDLRAAVERIGPGAASAAQARPTEPPRSSTETGADAERLLAEMATRMEDGYSRFLTEYEGDASLSSLRSIITAMATLSGRKSILYFSEQLPLTSRLRARFDSLTGEANRANVTVYAVDAAGLRVESQRAQMASGIGDSGRQGIGDASRGDGAYTKELERQSDSLSSGANAAARRLAEDTGGFLVENTSDLAKGVARMQVERANYYLLGYQPSNAAADGKFRKVSVKVKRGKYTVRARPGYVAAK